MSVLSPHSKKSFFSTLKPFLIHSVYSTSNDLYSAKEMLFPRRRYQVVPCDWTSKSTHPIPRHRTDSALRFPSLHPPRQPRPCPRNPRGAEGAAPLPPGRRRETSYGASGKLLPFGIGGCIHHGCNVSTFSCRDVFHAHSRVLPFGRTWRTPRGYNVSAAPPHHALCTLLPL